MTARDRILAKHPDVQEALRIMMVADSVKEGDGLDWEMLAERALAQWETLIAKIGEQEGDWTEDAIARRGSSRTYANRTCGARSCAPERTRGAAAAASHTAS